MKHCTLCKIDKSQYEFYKSKTIKDGLQTWCKSCIKETQAQSRKENSDKHSQWSKKNYYKNRAKIINAPRSGQKIIPNSLSISNLKAN
jgi:hypothetical protein